MPLSQQNLACYTAFLASRIKYSSVRQYLNIVRLLHIEAGLPNPVGASWLSTSVLKGVRRSLGDACSPKLPISVDILLKMFYVLDLSSPLDICFWGAALTAFFSFLRKSHIVPASGSGSVANLLTRADVHFLPDHVNIHIRHTKTIQFQERGLQVPMPRIPDSVLCPAQALLLALNLVPDAPQSGPLFVYVMDGRSQVLTYNVFISKLRGVLSTIGMDPSQYAGHSFRRGGASLALASNVPTVLVKMQGDWRSNAYERYIEPSKDLKLSVARSMARHAKESSL